MDVPTNMQTDSSIVSVIIFAMLFKGDIYCCIDHLKEKLFMLAARRTQYHDVSFNEHMRTTWMKLNETDFFEENARFHEKELTWLVTLFTYGLGKPMLYNKYVPFLLFSDVRDNAEGTVRRLYNKYVGNVKITPESLGASASHHSLQDDFDDFLGSIPDEIIEHAAYIKREYKKCKAKMLRADASQKMANMVQYHLGIAYCSNPRDSTWIMSFSLANIFAQQKKDLRLTSITSGFEAAARYHHPLAKDQSDWQLFVNNSSDYFVDMYGSCYLPPMIDNICFDTYHDLYKSVRKPLHFIHLHEATNYTHVCHVKVAFLGEKHPLAECIRKTALELVTANMKEEADHEGDDVKFTVQYVIKTMERMLQDDSLPKAKRWVDFVVKFFEDILQTYSDHRFRISIEHEFD